MGRAAKSVERMTPVPKTVRPQKAKRSGALTIETAADIRAGTAALRKLCPSMCRVHDLVGDPPLRRHASGFVGLARVVVGQQLSIASASAIWTRTALAVSPFDAETLLALDDATLRVAGLSQGKIRTLRAVAGAIVSRELDLEAAVSVEDLREAMLAIKGIGPWTADIYAMFCLGHADGFAPGDLALQLAAQRALALDSRPGPLELTEIAERWGPGAGWPRGCFGRSMFTGIRWVERPSDRCFHPYRRWHPADRVQKTPGKSGSFTELTCVASIRTRKRE